MSTDSPAQPECPACVCPCLQVWREGDYRGYQCRQCGLLITPSSGVDFEREYFGHHLHDTGVSGVRIKHFQTIIRRVEVDLPQPILDVGAGLGFFGRSLTQDMQAGLTLLEPSETARDHLRRTMDVRVVRDFDELREEHGRFGAITMWDVLAHVEDPMDILAKVFTFLRVGGLFVIKTPNHPLRLFRTARLLSPLKKGRSLLHVPSMRYHFVPQSLRRLLDEAGFAVLSTQWVNEAPIKIGEGVGAMKGIGLRCLRRAAVGPLSFLTVAQRTDRGVLPESIV